jgi:hypothetical protein
LEPYSCVLSLPLARDSYPIEIGEDAGRPCQIANFERRAYAVVMKCAVPIACALGVLAMLALFQQQFSWHPDSFAVVHDCSERSARAPIAVRKPKVPTRLNILSIVGRTEEKLNW